MMKLLVSYELLPEDVSYYLVDNTDENINTLEKYNNKTINLDRLTEDEMEELSYFMDKVLTSENKVETPVSLENVVKFYNVGFAF